MSEAITEADVAPGLLELLRKAGDEYGPLGVALVAASLTDERVLLDSLRVQRAEPTEAAEAERRRICSMLDRIVELDTDVERHKGVRYAADMIRMHKPPTDRWGPTSLSDLPAPDEDTVERICPVCHGSGDAANAVDIHDMIGCPTCDDSGHVAVPPPARPHVQAPSRSWICSESLPEEMRAISRYTGMSFVASETLRTAADLVEARPDYSEDVAMLRRTADIHRLPHSITVRLSALADRLEECL